jgi:transposase
MELDDAEVQLLSVLVIIALIIASFFFLRSKKIRTPLNTPMRIIEKPVEKIVIKEVIKEKPVVKYKEKKIPVEKIVTKEVIKEKPGKTKIALIEVEKKKEPAKPRSKYVGSNYNEKYHLRTCRFAGAIKKEYLIEENKNKFFKLRGYTPCKVCHPEKD